MKIPIAKQIWFDNILYNQHLHNNNLDVGNLVLDTADGLCGMCELIYTVNSKTYISIRDLYVVEIGVPIERVRLLKPAIETNSLN